MRGLSRFLTLLMIVLMPMTASAQFVPIQQAKELGNQNEQKELDTVLGDISDYSSTSRKQVQTILADAGSKKIGASAAGRKIETIIGNLKTKLNGVINTYAKKNPPAPSLRTAFNAAQDSLNNIRRQSSEVLDQVGFDKAAAPNQLSGKYLDYQNKIKDIAAKGLQTADDRLTAKGRRDAIKADLKKTVEDTQQQIEIATNSFLAVNSDLLPSALNRIKTTVLNDFSASMATRYKTADGLSNDKALDLTEDETKAIAAAKKEMSDAVDRALNTIEQLTTQVAGSGLPTSSSVPGVNPYLEAKFKADKQLKQIRDSVNSRIDTISSRFNSRSDVSALAKEIFKPEAQKEKDRLNDGVNEFETYFTAGDPTKKQYNNAKNKAQDAAEGCNDFFCDLGRVVSTVGSGLLSSATKGVVNIAPQTFTGIMGIDDAKGYVPSKYTGSNYGSVANVNGRYYAPGISGGTTVPFNPNCIGDLPSIDATKGLAFIGVAKAEDGDPFGIGAFSNSTNGDSSSDRGSTSAGADAGAGAYGIPDGASGGGSAAVDPGVGQETKSNGTKTTTTTTTKSSTGLFGVDWSQYAKYAPFLQGTIFGGTPSGQRVFGQCYGQYGMNGSLPGQFGSVYNSPFGGLPVGQTLGFPNNNVQLNNGLLGGTNYAAQLAIGLGLKSQLGGPYASQYAQAAKIFGEGPMTLERFAQVAQVLQQTDFFSRSTLGTDPYDPSNYFYALCSQIMGGGTQLVSYCKSMLTPTNTVGINPNGGNIFSPRTAATQDPDLAQIATDIASMDSINGFSVDTKCKTSSYVRLESEIVGRLEKLSVQYLSSSGSANRNQVLAQLGQLRQRTDSYKLACNGAQANVGGFAAAQTGGVSAIRTKINEYSSKIDDFNKAKNCDDDAVVVVDAMDTLSLRAELNENTNDANYARALNEIVSLENKKQAFCNSRFFSSAASQTAQPTNTGQQATGGNVFAGLFGFGNDLGGYAVDNKAAYVLDSPYGLYAQLSDPSEIRRFKVTLVSVSSNSNLPSRFFDPQLGVRKLFFPVAYYSNSSQLNTYNVWYSSEIGGDARNLGSVKISAQQPTWCVSIKPSAPVDSAPYACTPSGSNNF